MKLSISSIALKALGKKRIVDLGNKITAKERRIEELEERIKDLRGDRFDADLKERFENDIRSIKARVKQMLSDIKKIELHMEYCLSENIVSYTDLKFAGFVEQDNEK